MFVAAVAAAVLSSCSGGGQQGLPTSDEFPVRTLGASSAELVTTYPATIKGIQDVEIRPKVAGFITKLCVSEGQAVSAGQLLFVIDNATYQAAVRQAEAAVNSAKASVTTAQASVKSAEAQLATARLTYNNSQQLYNNKVIGSYELETAKNTYNSAVAAANQANSGVASAQAAVAQAEASLATAKENLSYCYVKAPTSGLVGSLPYKVGALVSSSSVEPLTTITNVGNVEVYFSMTEKDILDLTKTNGSLASAVKAFPAVKLKLADGSTYSHNGTVVKSTGNIDQTTGTVTMIAQFSNAEHLLKSGGSGYIVVPHYANSSIIIPQDAVSQVQDKMFVYTVGGDNKVHYTAVTVNTQNDGKNYIITSGLKAGDRIVLKGVTSLTDGQQIKPVTEKEYEEILKKTEEMGKDQSDLGKLKEDLTGK